MCIKNYKETKKKYNETILWHKKIFFYYYYKLIKLYIISQK